MKTLFGIFLSICILITSPVHSQTPNKSKQISGTVKDEFGETMPGVAVAIKGTNHGVTTDAQGMFTLPVQSSDTLVVRFLGYETAFVHVKEKKKIDIVIKEKVNEINTVVITTGIVKRDKAVFSGAVTTATGEELKNVGNSNIIESLKSMDPEFLVLDNTISGSDPNVTSNIQMRGQTSIKTTGLGDQFGQDPNQPLFILDGFETSLRTITDLDMNRVASITILKDAASTAMYGANAANGVVVVETIKPKPGEIRVSYTGDFQLQTPDLSVYNMMDAREKLLYEEKAGYWTASGTNDIADLQSKLDAAHNQYAINVARGIDTYWLRVPVQVGFTQNHSGYVSGGTDELTYGVGLNYKNLNGVMKGSGRDTWGGQVKLGYRKDKWNVSNTINISGYNATNSPYGSFNSYANANPYFPLYDQQTGNIEPYLQDDLGFSGSKILNPAYRSTLNNQSSSENIIINNNFQLEYRFNDHFRWTESIQLNRSSTGNINFLSSQDPSFFGINDYTKKGSYKESTIQNSAYTINSMLTYSEIYKEKHVLTVNARNSISQNKNALSSIQAVGFPDGAIGIPSFAFSYADGKPGYSNQTVRRNSFLLSSSYSFDRTYFADATYRLDGSTTFGSNNTYTPFWSFGAGVNLDKVLQFNSELIQLLKLRANIGTTANQNFGNTSSTTIYKYMDDINIFGQGYYIFTPGNPNLDWQKTQQTSIGTDLEMINNRLKLTFNIYRKETDPLVIPAPTAASTGMTSYAMNKGALTYQGFSFKGSYAIINKDKQDINWTVGFTGTIEKGVYSKFGTSSSTLNDSTTTNSLYRYQDGYSPTALWAYPSLGIDPASGSEIFINKEGVPQVGFNKGNGLELAMVGDSNPKIIGAISQSVRYKQFTLTMILGYSLGGEIFNTSLYNNVENITTNTVHTQNQDKRALYDRWQAPGDIAQFTDITALNGATNKSTSSPMSSRFIQTENYLNGQSLSLQYRFNRQPWMKRIGVKDLKLSAYANDLFRLTNIRIERGTAYPFSRSFSMSINASF